MNPKNTPSLYVHGTTPEEQDRLSQLNEYLNRRCLDELAPKRGEKILDVGSGLGQLSCALARAVGKEGRVLGIERSAEQRAGAERVRSERCPDLAVEFRDGDVLALPLTPEERGSFDIVHCRWMTSPSGANAPTPPSGTPSPGPRACGSEPIESGGRGRANGPTTATSGSRPLSEPQRCKKPRAAWHGVAHV